MNNLCGKCFGPSNFTTTGVHEDGRTYKIYKCPSCGKETRVFDVPLTEQEVVLVALVAEALSDISPALDVPEREKFVEDQLRLWNDEPRVWY